MRKVLAVLIIMQFLNIYGKGVSFITKLKFENYYDNNILKLSDSTLNEFEAGTDPNKFRIESSDDLVTSASLDLGIKHYFVGGHTQINRIIINYNNYWNNGFKNDGYIRFNLKQFLSKSFSFQFNYYYYPKIYSNDYKSVLDDKYHSYTYTRNVYNASLRWQLFKKLEVQYRFEYGQNYFNKYFTEYDCRNIESRIDLKFKLLSNLYSTLSYAFKMSDADGEDAYNDIQGNIQYKDASYEANLFFIQFTVPKLFLMPRGPVQFRAKVSFNGYFYQSNISGDDYHIQRDDNLIKLLGALTCPISDGLDLEIFLNRDERRTESPYDYVEDDKNYCRLKSGFSLKLEF